MPKPVRRVDKPAHRKKPKRKPYKKRYNCVACKDTGKASKGGPCICAIRGGS